MSFSGHVVKVLFFCSGLRDTFYCRSPKFKNIRSFSGQVVKVLFFWFGLRDTFYRRYPEFENIRSFSGHVIKVLFSWSGSSTTPEEWSRGKRGVWCQRVLYSVRLVSCSGKPGA